MQKSLNALLALATAASMAGGMAYADSDQTPPVSNVPATLAVQAPPAPRADRTVTLSTTTSDALPTTLVGRRAGFWRQTAPDFRAATLDGVAITMAGSARLAPVLSVAARPVGNQPLPHFTGLAEGIDGAVYAGSEQDGSIYRIAADGTARLWASTGEATVLSLIRAADGAFYAGTAPNGRIYRIGADGKALPFGRLREHRVLALALSPDGKTLYASAGDDTSRVYSLPTVAKKGFFAPAKQIYADGTSTLNALTVALDGVVYAGAAPDGKVLKIAGVGGVALDQPTVIYDAHEDAIAGLTLGSDNALYAVTAPRGTLYRIDLSGAQPSSTRIVYDETPDAQGMKGLQAAPDGTRHTSTGSNLIAVDSHTGTARSFESESPDLQVRNILRTSDGRLWVTAANRPGVYCLNEGKKGDIETGYLTSGVLDAHKPAQWGQIRWNGDAPVDTTIALETRSGNTPQPDPGWSPWSRDYVARSGEQIVSPSARYLQYRATLIGRASSEQAPTLSGVEVFYQTPNRAPELTLHYPMGDDMLRGLVAIRWRGSDADGDTLTYKVELSSDGVNWKSLQSPQSIYQEHPEVDSSDVTSNDLLQQLTDHPEIDYQLRQRILAEAQAAKRPGDPTGSASSDEMRAPVVAEPAITPSPFDLGRARRRLPSADHRIGQPLEFDRCLTTELISPEFRIANHAPRLVLFHRGIVVRPDGVVRLEGVVIGSGVAIRGVQFRIDGGAWFAAAAKDGIFDSATEEFIVTTPALAAGRHTIEVQAQDEAGNAVETRAEVGK